MDASDLQIVEARAEHLDTLVAFNRALAKETEGKSLDAGVVRSGVEAGLADDARARYFLAFSGDRPVGQLMLTFEWSDWRNGFFWWIQSVYVEPGARRGGVFRRLYAHVRASARAEPGVCGLRLYVLNTNHDAIRTYQSLGMQLSAYHLCEEDWS